MTDCIFCRIVSGDIVSTRVFEDERAVAFLDANPMEKGHVLVVPRAHWASLPDVPPDAASLALYDGLARAVRLLAKAALRAGWDGANVLQCSGESAGQTVPHLHFHVIPRRKGGPVPPAFESGAGRYADDFERDAHAAKWREAVAGILKEEGRLP